MSDDIARPTVLKKTWNTTDALDGLLLQLPGRAFIKYDATILTNALVQVESNSQELLDLIVFNVSKTDTGTIDIGCKQVLALDRPRQSFLNITASSAEDAHAFGSLIIHVTVRHPLHWVKSTAESYLSSGTLANGADKRVSITSIGTGNVSAVASYPVSLANLTLATVGSGNVQFIADSISGGTDVISLNVVGAGSVAIQATDYTIHKLHTSIAGTGSIFVSAKGSIHAPEVKTVIVGKGNVNYYPQGTTNDNTIELTGSGSAYTGSLIAQNSSVKVWGSGSAVVQVVDTLAATISGSGKVEYVNTTTVPAHLPKPKGWWIFSSPSATPTNETKYNTFKFGIHAVEQPLDVVIDLNRSSAGRCIVQHFQTENVVQTNALAIGSSAPFDEYLGVIAIAIVAFVAFVILKSKKRIGYAALPK